MLDDGLLHEYSEAFLGYGNLDAPYWFLGIGEGGGCAKDEVASRLAAWAALSRPEIADLHEFDRTFNLVEQQGRTGQSEPPITPWFVERPVIQTTWGGLIRLTLDWEQRSAPITETAIGRYQKEEWATAARRACLVEVLPVPSPSTDKKHWFYESWTHLPWFRTREAGLEHSREERIARIRTLIAERGPTTVVFYAVSPPDSLVWQAIPGGRFDATDVDGLWARPSGETQFLMMYHPSYGWRYEHRKSEDFGTCLDRVAKWAMSVRP